MSGEPTVESILETIRHAKSLDELRGTVRIFKKWARPPAGSEHQLVSALRERTLQILENLRTGMWVDILDLEQHLDKERKTKPSMRLVSDRS